MQGYYCLSILVVSIIKIASVQAWETPSPHQYHIQTDEGPERYFRYQTDNGQYRKEKRLEDGTVVGTYAWIDADGMLRQRDYIADNEGYRIVKTKNIYVGTDVNVGEAIKSTKKYPATEDTIIKTNQRSTLRVPYRGSVRGYTSVPFIRKSTSSSVPYSQYDPYVDNSLSNLQYSSSTPSSLSPATYTSSQTYSPTINPSSYRPSSFIPTTTSSPISPIPNVVSSTEEPVVEITPNSYSRTAHGYVPLNFSYFNGNYIYSTQIPLATTQSPYPSEVTTERPIYSSISPTYSPADFGASQDNDANSLEYNPYVRQAKDTYRFQNGPTYPLDKNGNSYAGSDPKYPASTYDGVSVTNDGFRYYIPRAYHEEQTQQVDRRSGSFGYIDPFGIRRVIYYNSAPGTGFQHRKNNRYVGFNATPYDPRPYRK